jgi:hypothetical protein
MFFADVFYNSSPSSIPEVLRLIQWKSDWEILEAQQLNNLIVELWPQHDT